MIRVAYVTGIRSDSYSWYVVSGINEQDCKDLVEQKHQCDSPVDIDVMTIEEANDNFSQDLPLDYGEHIGFVRVIRYDYGS